MSDEPKIIFRRPSDPEAFPDMPLFRLHDLKALYDRIIKEVRNPETYVRIPRPTPKPARDRFPLERSDCGSYGLHRTHEGLRTAVNRCMRALRPIANTFDALYVTGQSGEIPGAIVAWRLRKELIILRKTDAEGDTHSHGFTVEGDAYWRTGVRYIILDDFVAQAGTLKRLLFRKPSEGTLVGVCLYGHPRSDAEDEAQYAKRWTDGITNEVWRLVRRGPSSMMFDLVKEKPE